MGGAVAAKQQALIGGFFGSIAAGAAMGGLYGLLLGRPVLARHPLRTLVVAIAVAWLGMLAVLWPVLPASYIGLGPAPAAIATAAGFLLEFGAYAAVLYTVFQRAQPAERSADEQRRRVMLGLAAAVFGLGTAGAATFLYRNSALGYDGMTYDGPVQALTPTQGFYVVTKNLIDPAICQPAWRLELAGKVD